MFTAPTSSRCAIASATDVLGPHRCRQPVLRVVCQPDRLFFVGDLHHRDRRAESLVTHAGHRMIDVKKNRGLEEPAIAGRLSAGRDGKSSRPRVSSRGSATRDAADLSVHRRAQGAVRGRTYLPRTGRARRADRPAHLLGAPIGRTVEAGAVGRHHHRDPRRRLRARHRGRPPEALYGSSKMWAHLQRRARRVRTTVADPAATRAPDLVGRRFRVDTPNRLLVADFTYVPMVTGVFGYTAFVIDAYAGLIPGRECSLSKKTDRRA